MSYQRNLPLNQRRAEASVESPITSQIQADEQQPTGPGKIPPQRIEDEVRSTGCERPRNTEKTRTGSNFEYVLDFVGAEKCLSLFF